MSYNIHQVALLTLLHIAVTSLPCCRCRVAVTVCCKWQHHRQLQQPMRTRVASFSQNGRLDAERHTFASRDWLGTRWTELNPEIQLPPWRTLNGWRRRWRFICPKICTRVEAHRVFFQLTYLSFLVILDISDSDGMHLFNLTDLQLWVSWRTVDSSGWRVGTRARIWFSLLRGQRSLLRAVKEQKGHEQNLCLRISSSLLVFLRSVELSKT